MEYKKSGGKMQIWEKKEIKGERMALWTSLPIIIAEHTQGTLDGMVQVNTRLLSLDWLGSTIGFNVKAIKGREK